MDAHHFSIGHGMIHGLLECPMRFCEFINLCCPGVTVINLQLNFIFLGKGQSHSDPFG